MTKTDTRPRGPEAPTLDWPGVEHVLPRRAALATLLGTLGGGLGGTVALATGAPPPGAASPEPWARPRPGPAPRGALPFVRVYADPDGRTQIETRELDLSSAPARGLFEGTAETFALRVIPPGTFFDWHKPSRRRMIGVLRGSATMTLRDGRTARAVPGMVLLVENTQGEGHRGHFDETDYTLTFDVGLPAA